jgi:hypothetical protein
MRWTGKVDLEPEDGACTRPIRSKDLTQIREYDVVRVIRLRTENRTISGSAGVMRPPGIGDIATVVHEFRPEDPLTPVIVEHVDECVSSGGFGPAC